jgi:effector-binding domain-containing protein
MPRVSPIALFKKTREQALVIRTKASVRQLPQLIGESYAKLAGYLAELGEVVTDVPFVGYHNMDMENLDVEIGFPVAGPLPDKDNMTSVAFPEGYAVFCMYRGAYGEMAGVYDEMARWIGENNLLSAGASYEHYYNGPDVPESELLTKICMPVFKKD